MRGRARAAAILLGCAALAAAVALALAPAREVTTRIAITATPAQVWAVLTDTQAYPAWNPDNRLFGRLEPGQVIEHDVGQGSNAWVFHPVVRAATPGRELRWFGRVWFWHLFDAEHSFLLSPTAQGTLLVQSEHLRGVALWVFDVAGLARSFDEVNAALKRRVEAIR